MINFGRTMNFIANSRQLQHHFMSIINNFYSIKYFIKIIMQTFKLFSYALFAFSLCILLSIHYCIIITLHHSFLTHYDRFIVYFYYSPKSYHTRRSFNFYQRPISPNTTLHKINYLFSWLVLHNCQIQTFYDDGK